MSNKNDITIPYELTREDGTTEIHFAQITNKPHPMTQWLQDHDDRHLKVSPECDALLAELFPARSPGQP